jgi:hypothetical protein
LTINMGIPIFVSIETPLRIARSKSSPLFRDTPCRITTGPNSKAAMNRPKRFRGLATDPGVQRKAPRTVIQRENKPKGPRLEEHLSQASDRRQLRVTAESITEQPSREGCLG